MRRNFINYLLWCNILFVSATRKDITLRKDRKLYYGDQNVFDRPKSEECAEQANLLPDPKTLCCGRNHSDTDRITDGNELDQFPWSTLLKATFKNGDNLSVYSCGGSLISRLYVLTAAHCVSRPGEPLFGIDITLTEYDEDCEEACVDKVLLQAEDVIRQPHFDDEKLRHDIALIRLQEYTSTRYITPVCLPTMNVDHMHLSDLPLVVAGWERNGPHVSHTKQATVVHLVPHAECHRSYPLLTRSHLCAAGRTDEDTRKGDSGGPLMMMFKGSYYVIGVMSGKRESHDIGKTMPSLYTNVFHYVNWIRHNMKI